MRMPVQKKWLDIWNISERDMRIPVVFLITILLLKIIRKRLIQEKFLIRLIRN